MAAVSHASNADLKIASVLNTTVHHLTANKVDLRSTVMPVAATNGTGSLARKIPQVLFDEVMAAPGEATTVNNSTLGDDAKTVTAARQALRYDMSDEFFLSGGSITPEDLAQGLVEAYYRRISTLIGEIVDGFADTAGTTATALTVDDIYDAIFAIHVNDLGATRHTFAGAPKQFNDFMASLRGEGGANMWIPATADMLGLKGQGFKGSWHGIDFITHATTKTDATDWYGAVYAPFTVALMEMTVGALRGLVPANAYLDVASDSNIIWVEKQRVSEDALTKYVGNVYAGVALNEDVGVTVRTSC
jgi:hypothetical protein